VKLTAATITDAQIRELYDELRQRDEWIGGGLDCEDALFRLSGHEQARARCAEILNAKNHAYPVNTP